MEIQVINLSQIDVFKSFSSEYKIFRESYHFGLTGLELRNLPEKLAGSVQKIVLNENEICYKIENPVNKTTNILVPGLLGKIKELARKIIANGDEDLGYKIINCIKNFEEYDLKTYSIGNKVFSFNQPYVMGILNVTPDSFSDGGLYEDAEDAVNYGMKMIEDGADIIDIGGESSRPGSENISVEEELKRVIPVLDGILSAKPEIIISIDTTKKKVADNALAHGAQIINDISALTFEPKLAESVKKYNGWLILMHMKGTPKDMQKNPVYENLPTGQAGFIREIYDFLSERLQFANQNGVKKTLIDPGIGFGKSVDHNFELIRRLGDFKSLGSPILIGVSRKSFIGKTLNLEVSDRDTATASIESIAIKNGAKIIRTHNVKFGVQVCKLLTHLA